MLNSRSNTHVSSPSSIQTAKGGKTLPAVPVLQQKAEANQSEYESSGNTDLQAADRAQQGQSGTNNTNSYRQVPSKPFQLKPDNQVVKNNTGLPDNLKSGIENLSAFSMDDVKVHYNSDKPAQLRAFAYTQGTDIHVGSGQEKHLPHEAWHVVQQKQGQVKPTMQMKGVGVNDDAGLESEADEMGRKAVQLNSTYVVESMGSTNSRERGANSNIFGTVQRVVDENLDGVSEVIAITDDVFSVTHKGGTIIIKFKGDLSEDTIADNALRAVGANAPESKLVSAGFLLGKLPEVNKGPGATEKLRIKLKSKEGTNVLVAEKLPGEALGKDATTPSKKTIGFLADPFFAFDLGMVAAYDSLIGNQDRILGGINFGNMLMPNGNGLQQIDNQLQDNEMWLAVVNMEQIFNSVLGEGKSKLATKIEELFKELYGVSGFKVDMFNAGFVLALEKIISMKDALVEYLKEKESKGIKILAINAERLGKQVESSELFGKALETAKIKKVEMIKSAQEQKEKKRQELEEKQKKEGFSVGSLFSSLFGK